MQREEFARQWDAVYPLASQIWRRNWERIVPFFADPREIRKVIYARPGQFNGKESVTWQTGSNPPSSA